MDTIRIGAGVKRIAINDDPERVIVFDPSGFPKKGDADREPKDLGFKDRSRPRDPSGRQGSHRDDVGWWIARVTVFRAPRRSPLSPALSPEYRGEGVGA